MVRHFRENILYKVTHYGIPGIGPDEARHGVVLVTELRIRWKRLWDYSNDLDDFNSFPRDWANCETEGGHKDASPQGS